MSLTGIKGGQERREAAAQHASRRRSMARTQLRRAAPILFSFPTAHWGPGPVTGPGRPRKRNERHMHPQNFDTPRGGSRDRRRSAWAGDTPLIQVQRALPRSHELLLFVGLEEGPACCQPPQQSQKPPGELQNADDAAPLSPGNPKISKLRVMFKSEGSPILARH